MCSGFVLLSPELPGRCNSPMIVFRKSPPKFRSPLKAIPATLISHSSPPRKVSTMKYLASIVLLVGATALLAQTPVTPTPLQQEQEKINIERQQLLVSLLNGPDGKQWLEAYTWAKTNGCEPKLVMFHPHKTRQAIRAYKEARMALPEDERERVVALCGK